VYFETLRILAAILFVAYLLYLPTIWFYASTSYDPANNGDDNMTMNHWWYDAPLRGSLMCRHTVWVPCLDCPIHAFPADRLATTANTTTEDEDASSSFLFVLKNDCSPMRWAEGVNHLIVVVFCTISMIALGFYQKHLELRYDESVLTASDYSIIVTNPPEDAVDANEWKLYFERLLLSIGNGDGRQVKYCTVALDNAELVAALVERRAGLLQAVHHDVDDNNVHGGAHDDRTAIQPVPEHIRTVAPEWAQRCDRIEAKCRALLQVQVVPEKDGDEQKKKKKQKDEPKKLLGQRRYGATKVFVTFDTEKSQRDVLRLLWSRDPRYAFRRHGELRQQQEQPEQKQQAPAHVLHVQEAMEPSVVRWQDLHATRTERWTQRGLGCLLTVFFMYLSLHTVWYAFRHWSVEIAALIVALFSAGALPFLERVNRLEQHTEESSYQASLFCKLMAFRFVNAVVATLLITPFTETVGEKRRSLIPAIYAVLQAEVIVTPLVNMMDPVGHCNRLFLAPFFANNQAAMNSYFKGSPENFGNKYTVSVATHMSVTDLMSATSHRSCRRVWP
jgi:hypothetical protein